MGRTLLFLLLILSCADLHAAKRSVRKEKKKKGVSAVKQAWNPSAEKRTVRNPASSAKKGAPTEKEMRAALNHLAEVKKLLKQIELKERKLKGLTDALSDQNGPATGAVSGTPTHKKSAPPASEADVSKICALGSVDKMKECLLNSIRDLTQFSESIAEHAESDPKAPPPAKRAVPSTEDDF